MFGMGLQELLLVCVVAVVVIGPRQLPQVARGLGRMLAQLQRASNELRDLMHEEADRLEQESGLNELKQQTREEVEVWGSLQREVKQEIDSHLDTSDDRLPSSMKSSKRVKSGKSKVKSGKSSGSRVAKSAPVSSSKSPARNRQVGGSSHH